MTNISVIICTYNPSHPTFQRVLSSVAALIIPSDCSVDYCLVDNNSSPAVQESSYVQEFLAKLPQAKLICETTQGLSAARMAGVEATSAPVLVFLDDDNQPEPDYLVNLASVLQKYPQVGVWGPGRIQVEFTEQVQAWVQSYKWLYQERKTDAVTIGTEQHWTDHHPTGTGQVVRRDIMLRYADMLKNNTVTLTDRNGGSLASGGDAQIVYTAIKHGYSVGLAPGLTIHHLIPGNRTRIKYVKRLLYNIMSSGAVANIEIFPEQKAYYYSNIRSPRLIMTTLARIIGSSIRDRSLTNFQMNSGSYLGKLAGSYAVISGKLPYWLTLSVRLLKLQ